MTADCALTNLTNHFLIAMPGLQDDLFARSVVYVCEHGEQGAMGLIINQSSDLSLKALLEKMDLTLERRDLQESAVYVGGPVQTERGFVLHEATFDAEHQPDQPVYTSTMAIGGGLEMTTSRDVLEAVATGSGPRQLLVALGYSAWGEGQLESELANNSWLTVPADWRLIFETPAEQRYEQALQLLGMEPWMLLPQAGHA
jgi:putative transcriptional regulator